MKDESIIYWSKKQNRTDHMQYQFRVGSDLDV